MTDPEIQQIADRVILTLQNLAPGEPGWWVPWTAWGSYAGLVVAAVAFIVGLRTLKQKREADAKSEWWRRAQWALEATSSEDTIMYSYGTEMLALLTKSKLTDVEDRGLLDAVWKASSTGMRDEDIKRLIETARNLAGLTDEEEASINSFESPDDPPEPPPNLGDDGF
ncbi:MAG: hypothetical protein ABI563_05780 [Specibacter sp.]